MVVADLVPEYVPTSAWNDECDRNKMATLFLVVIRENSLWFVRISFL